MTGQHVGKKTYNQCEGSRKYAQQLHKYQDWLYTYRNRRIQCMRPKMLATANKNNYKGNHAKNKRERNITRNVCSTRYQSDNTINQNKEEDGQHVGHVSLILV